MSRWGWPRLVVHRCGGALAPENTLAGLGVAARLGCVAVEFDVMLSGDGVPVLIHDETLDRVAGRPGQVSRLAADELLATDVGRCFHPAFSGETIPALEAALLRCRQLGLSANLEIKPAAGFEVETGRVVGSFLAAAHSAGLPPLLLSSFSAQALEAAALEVEALPRAFLTTRFDAQALAPSRLCVAESWQVRLAGGSCGGSARCRFAYPGIHRQFSGRGAAFGRVGCERCFFRPSRAPAA